MKNWLTSNSKLKKDGILAWSIPAYKSTTGRITCPMAGVCAAGCYARQGFFVMPSTQKALEARLELSRDKGFTDVLTAEIQRRKPARVRIHASGDFYSPSYFAKWLVIAIRNPDVQFYAYTKMVGVVKDHVKDLGPLPSNLTVIFSFGGKQDHLIDTSKDRHSRVFPDARTLVHAGYSDAHERDVFALTLNHRVGLVYHGAASKAWAS